MNLFQEFLSFGNWKSRLTPLSTPSEHPTYKSLLNPIQGVNRNFLAPLSPPLDRSDSTQGFHVRASSELSARAQAEGSPKSRAEAISGRRKPKGCRQVPLALPCPVLSGCRRSFTLQAKKIAL